MDSNFIYLAFVIILITLAAIDLMVGVSNDAVNFLNSGVGSKSVPFWLLMVIASMGVIAGATFSSGMMEVAQKGVFDPAMFNFHEVMIIFLAVMLTDVLLLDLFNTFGLPTSTTVSLIFELFGAAVAMSLIKILGNNDSIVELAKYIKSEQILVFVFAILLSVVLAFSFGMGIQFILRLLFTFDLSKTYKYFGALWGAIAITLITYFLLIKGAKGASFMTQELKDYIKIHTLELVGISFVFWIVVLQVLSWVAKVNILKIIVLTGTFALAMAFAGNDMVNFIGAPMAGLKSYQLYSASGASATDFNMAPLAGKLKTETLYLLIAGIVMVMTLWLSKKAKTVTETEVSLGRQDEGYERFGSTMFSRSIVRSFIGFGGSIQRLLPAPVWRAMERRFDRTKLIEQNRQLQSKDTPSFDLVRASTNLVVSSALIALGTSFKLPLSTTYVTFIVAMGSSLADGAWGRESAVYRLTGVLSVIAGWFVTALIAFTSAFIIAITIFYGSWIAVVLLLALGAYLGFRLKVLHSKREQVKEERLKIEVASNDENALDAHARCITTVNATIQTTARIFTTAIEAFLIEDRKSIKRAIKDIDVVDDFTDNLKFMAPQTIQKLGNVSIEAGTSYIQIVDYLREVQHSVHYIVYPCFEHIENNHKGFLPTQKEELRDLADGIAKLFKMIDELQKFEQLETIVQQEKNVLDKLDNYRLKQIKRIQTNETGKRNSMLYFNVLAEIKNYMLHTIHLLKAQRDFIAHRPVAKS